MITTAQLSSCGIDKDGVAWRVSTGRLHRLYRGVYSVGHRRLSRKGWWTAATLACGEGAVISDRSAAELWELIRPGDGPIHVTVRSANGRSPRPGIRIHRRPALPTAAATMRDGIPVTTPARTVADLRRASPAWLVRRAIREAELKGYPVEFHTDRTRSDLEQAVLAICRRHRVPEPEVNATIGPYTVDFLWADRRLVVEVDSYRYHSGRQAFRDDRDRDIEIGDRGFQVRRLADSRIDDDPGGIGRLLQRWTGADVENLGP